MTPTKLIADNFSLNKSIADNTDRTTTPMLFNGNTTELARPLLFKAEIIKNKEDQTNAKKSARQTVQGHPLKNSSKNNDPLNADTAKPSVRSQLEAIKNSQTKKPLKPIRKTHNR